MPEIRIRLSGLGGGFYSNYSEIVPLLSAYRQNAFLLDFIGFACPEKVWIPSIALLRSKRKPVKSIYEAWKDSEGHWNAMIDPYLEYCSVARYNGFWVFLEYAGNPILDMTTQEAVEQGLLEHINTAENGSEIYASPDSDVHVETEEERKEAEALGWDW